MFKRAIMHYPKDEKMMKAINKEIAAFHCAVAIKYMDTIKLNEQQKVTLLTSIAADMAANQV